MEATRHIEQHHWPEALTMLAYDSKKEAKDGTDDGAVEPHPNLISDLSLRQEFIAFHILLYYFSGNLESALLL